MGSRLELQTLLETLIGSENVYFQPPSGFTMLYPCIVYRSDHIKIEYANNFPYTLGIRYSVTVIDRNPDSLIPGKVAMLPKCAFERYMVVDNLNHYIFNLYF